MNNHNFILFQHLALTISAALLPLLLLLSSCPTPTVAPFPPEDPRSVFNAFVLPWWSAAPYWFRQRLHIHFTGKPLPPEEPRESKPVRWRYTGWFRNRNRNRGHGHKRRVNRGPQRPPYVVRALRRLMDRYASNVKRRG